MDTPTDARRIATPEQEENVRAMFPLDLSPEEYAGRYGARLLIFGLDRFRYHDPAVDAWIRRLGEILHTPGLLACYQEQYLTQEELAALRAAEAEDTGDWCCPL